MIICYFYVLSVMIIACAMKQRNDRRRMVQYEVFSTSTRLLKQQEYIHHIVFESGIKCIHKLRMHRHCFHELCQLLTTSGGLRGTIKMLVSKR